MFSPELLATWFAVFARGGALLIAAPVFSQVAVPVPIRVALATLVAFLVAPLLPPLTIANYSLWDICRLLVIEITTGLLLGFVCRLIFFALETAGGMISNEMGLSMSSLFNPLTNAPAQVPSALLYWMALMLLLSLDLHHWMLAAFQRSYALVPIGAARTSEVLATDLIVRTGQTFAIGLRLAAPVVAVSFVVTFVFLVLGRAVPQINIFSESMPVRSLVGLGAFGMTCSYMAQHVSNHLRRLPEDMLAVARVLGGG